MEDKMLNNYIQKLEDYVFLEEKIVTCVWLSQNLKVHANTAKQLLHAFLQSNDVKEKVTVVYLVGGELADGTVKLKLVKDNERDEIKSLFSKVSSDHIFSIQKSADSLSSTDIYNAYPHFSTEDHTFCAVKPPKGVEKREIKQPIVERKTETSRPPVKENKVVEKTDSEKSASSTEPPAKPKEASPKKNANNASKEGSPEKNTKNKVTKGGIADLFNKQNDKNKDGAVKPYSKKAQDVKKKPAGIGGFFQKQPPKSKESDNEAMDVDSDPPPIKETNNKIEEKEKVAIDKKVENNVKDTKDNTSNKKSKGKENRKKRKKQDEKEDDSRKKRKRIATVFSSDSESSANEMSDVEMEPEPAPAKLPEQKDDEEEDIIPPTPGRKRVRKQIDKTYKDEDGFIITKKEFVYESCTDDEGVEEPKRPKESESITNSSSKKSSNEENSKKSSVEDSKKASTKKSPVKKKSPKGDKAGNKQASIMSFFKKK